MKKKFLFYLCGDSNKASSRVRGYWVAEELAESGKICQLEHRNDKISLFLFLLRIPFFDNIVFQKTYSRWHCWLLRWANFLRKKTTLDLDDAPSRTNHPITLKNVEFMMRNASAVTVGSRVLFEYASRFSKNVHLIPSSIRLEYYQPINSEKRLGEAVCLGWIGNGKHYKRDLISILKEPLTEVAKYHPIRFKLIGACGQRELYGAFENIPGLELDFIDQIEWSNSNAVVEALRDIDVGLYPLLPNEFNKYKCGFKALEYMAMKIPVVSSNVAENREIVEPSVTGFLAESSEEWQKFLLKLIENDSLREKMGSCGRSLVEESFSIKKQHLN